MFRVLALPLLVLFSLLVGAANHLANAEDSRITLYQSGESLVEESVKLPASRTVSLSNLPLRVSGETLQLLNNQGKPLAIQQKRFRYDALDRQTILPRLVGQSVRFCESPCVGDADERTYSTGILKTSPLTAAKGGALRLGSYAIVTVSGHDTLVPTSNIMLNQVPSGLALSPQLQVKLFNPIAQQATLQYLTRGLGWTAHYEGLLLDETNLSLSGWVTVNNRSGKAFNEAKLQLVAGQLNRRGSVQRRKVLHRAYAKSALMEASVAAAPAEASVEALSEFYLYTLPNPVSLKASDSVQLPWMNPTTFKVSPRYVFDPNPGHLWFGYRQSGGGVEKQPMQSVSSYIKLKNTQKPLPSGSLKLFKSDRQGYQHLIAEESLPHTAKNETLNLSLGQAFDIKGRKEQTDYRRGKDYEQASYTVTLTNQKDKAVTLEVLDHPNGEWLLVNSSTKASKAKRGQALQFDLTIPKQGKAELRYTVRTCWRNSKAGVFSSCRP